VAELSLRQRALAALARREYSRAELTRKLAPHAESAEEVARVMDGLEGEGLLSAERFAESLIHRRQGRYGNRRIALELKQHQLDPDVIDRHLASLAVSEVERCRAVWQKKFKRLPTGFIERAHQARFLSSRGFSAEAIGTILGEDSTE
jgi:regulatory protein